MTPSIPQIHGFFFQRFDFFRVGANTGGISADCITTPPGLLLKDGQETRPETIVTVLGNSSRETERERETETDRDRHTQRVRGREREWGIERERKRESGG